MTSIPVYDTIGADYNITRAADPYLTDRVLALLGPVPDESYLDIGCGTGNYLTALTRRDLHWTGIDPSATMIAAAQAQCPDVQLLRATAEWLPLKDAAFDGALAMLSAHHWTDLGTGFAEVARTLKPGARFVLFTFTPEQIHGYWLREYFPGMIAQAAARVPKLTMLLSLLHRAGFTAVTTEPYAVREDLQDHFLYSHKHRPAQYLRPDVRAGASGFRLLANAEEVTQGLARLEADIASGRIAYVVADAIRDVGDVGDYLFVVATVVH
jgi:ubiquinone/menaquinone biosynthesis C-methylase UbiE